MNVPAIPSVNSLPLVSQDLISPLQTFAPAGGRASFASMLVDGIDGVNSKILDADSLVRSFALDDSIPVHQVTFALEQAKMSLELMMQVRGRMVEAYQQFMNMQL